VRYFEVPPGAVTRLEKHEHEHYVIVGQGVGQAIVGEEAREVRQHDVVYVGPLQPHQFVNHADVPFGFFCIVSAQRDFAQLLSAEEVNRLLSSPAGAYIDPAGAPPPRHLRDAGG
jgi:quercetin dioxygenase-like cupin family protein